MPQAKANGIEIEYDTFGSPDDAPLLLIMGLGAQMITWDEAFCEQLAGEGFHVIRFDNRDVGLSTHLDTPVDVGKALAGDTAQAPYQLSDMAADAAGLLDALGIPEAHIVGASMGGMIAQLVAIEHASKTKSLCSIMSTTGDKSVGQPTPEAMGALLGAPPSNLEEAKQRAVEAGAIIGSPKYPTPRELAEARAERSYTRAVDPMGMARQLVAILGAYDRTEALGDVAVPTVVIHGGADPLVTPSGGEATAKAVRGANLVVIEGMGHDNPTELWPEIIGHITENARRAEGAA